MDADRFEELAGSGGAAAAAASRPADPATAAAALREALELWRGPALHDLPLEACRAAATRLDERRLAVLERRVDLDLRLGHFAELAAELAVLVQEHPLRERLWAQWMLALYGSGRQAEALGVFRRLRATLVEQLGIEPSALPRQVEQSVLAGREALPAYWREVGDPVAGSVRRRESDPDSESVPAPGGAAPGSRPHAPPAQLPAAIAAFTGRGADLDRLDALVTDAGQDGVAAGSVALAVIAGAAGVGKTALAVHWAHRVRDRFADGQLYVNLRGHAPAAADAAGRGPRRFLPALGIAAEQVPVDLDRAAALYRTVLADRRMLVVLDDARSAEQVRPLLPGSPGSVVSSPAGTGWAAWSPGTAPRTSRSTCSARRRRTRCSDGCWAGAGSRPSRRPPAELARLCGHCRWRCGSPPPT